MNKKNKNQLGFTLTELLTVVFIIGLISSILVVNWRRNEKQYLLQRIAQEIVQNIRKTQDMALNSLSYQDEIPDYSYGVYFDKDDKNSYLIFGDRNKNNTYQPSDIEVGNAIQIESGIEIASLSSENQDLDITFSIPDGFVNIEPLATSAVITIKRINGTCPQNCKNIIVRNTGQVNIE